MFVVNVATLTLWTIIDPLRWERHTIATDDFDRELDSIGSCSCKSIYTFAVPLLLVVIGSLVFANHQAFVARKIATEFAESDYIYRAMSIIVRFLRRILAPCSPHNGFWRPQATAAFIAIPVGMFADVGVRTLFFVRVGFVFLVSLSLLGFVFVPKILYKETKESFSVAIRSSMVMPNNDSTTIHIHDDTTSAPFLHEGDPVVGHPKLYHSMYQELLQLRDEKRRWEAGVVLSPIPSEETI